MHIISGEKIVMKMYGKCKCTAEIRTKVKEYSKKYRKYAFSERNCTSKEQYEAVITRKYHTIEKGLAYICFHPGFGTKKIDSLLTTMEEYIAEGYEKNVFFYKAAICVLLVYIEKNRKYHFEDLNLEKRITQLSKGLEIDRSLGGVISFFPPPIEMVQKLGYKDFFESRHSMRHFSKEPVDIKLLQEAIGIAQHTPSACNRQGWRTIIISNHQIILDVLKNQNGNEGFGHEIDKLLLITADIRYFNLHRELFQPYVDGGMYAQSVINALHYFRIASIPLSASLTTEQECNVRNLLKMDDAEIPILFIGTGNFPNEEECITTASRRHEAFYTIVE